MSLIRLSAAARSDHPVVDEHLRVTPHGVCLRDSAPGGGELAIRIQPQRCGGRITLKQRRQWQWVRWQRLGSIEKRMSVTVTFGYAPDERHHDLVVAGGDRPDRIDHAVREASPPLLARFESHPGQGVHHVERHAAQIA
nr:hypothetical protein GCM10020063_055520 [Dactylosporangium thailandense]